MKRVFIFDTTVRFRFEVEDNDQPIVVAEGMTLEEGLRALIVTTMQQVYGDGSEALIEGSMEKGQLVKLMVSNLGNADRVQ